MFKVVKFVPDNGLAIRDIQIETHNFFLYFVKHPFQYFKLQCFVVHQTSSRITFYISFNYPEAPLFLIFLNNFRYIIF
jgi:hypothetical protein